MGNCSILSYDGLIICNQKHSVKPFFFDNDMIIKKKGKHNQNRAKGNPRDGRRWTQMKNNPQMNACPCMILSRGQKADLKQVNANNSTDSTGPVPAI